MTGRLFIAEKPSVFKAIGEVLGVTKRHNGYVECGSDTVTFCVGHMMELAEPDTYTAADAPVHEKTGKKIWRVEDLPIIPKKWHLVPKKNLADQIKVIRGLVKKASIIVNAGDPDREGQLLIDELLEHFDYRGTVLRYWSAAQDSISVKRGLENLKPNREYYALGEAAKARSRADWLIGMNLTRAYTLAAQKGGSRSLLSVGRVQTPTLSIVVERDRKIEGFKPIPYFRLLGNFQHENGLFGATWKPSETQQGLDEDGRLIDATVADTLVTKLTGASGSICGVEKKPGKKEPPKAWSLANLQIAASAKHGLKGDQVLNACQALYETHKLTSYPRTDCPYLPESQHADAQAVLAALKAVNPELATIINKANPEIKSKTWNDAKITAHHGIIPTQHIGNIQALSDPEKAIYSMIVSSYLAQFFPVQEFERTVIDISVEGERFQARGKVVIKPGWTVVVADTAEEATEEASTTQALPIMGQGDVVTVSVMEKSPEKTKPPTRFSDGTLIEAMVNIHKFVEDPAQKKALQEDDGIGTPATRDSIIKELKNKGYLQDKGKTVVSTPLGRSLIDSLHPSVKSPAMTALFERIMKMIETDQTTVDTFIAKQSSVVAQEIERLSQVSIVVSGDKKPEASQYKCPNCGSALSRRASTKKKGQYWWGCTNYPTCKSTFFDNKGRPDPNTKQKP